MTIDEKIEVMQAYRDGKAIQFSKIHSDPPYPGWYDTSDPCWNFGDADYRIKKEPPKRWRGKNYYRISRRGDIVIRQDKGDLKSSIDYRLGNYFEDLHQAQSSSIDFMLNDDYEYSFPWMENKPELPSTYQVWHSIAKEWGSDLIGYESDNIIRWPKHPNDGEK